MDKTSIINWLDTQIDNYELTEKSSILVEGVKGKLSLCQRFDKSIQLYCSRSELFWNIIHTLGATVVVDSNTFEDNIEVSFNYKDHIFVILLDKGEKKI